MNSSGDERYYRSLANFRKLISAYDKRIWNDKACMEGLFRRAYEDGYFSGFDDGKVKGSVDQAYSRFRKFPYK